MTSLDKSKSRSTAGPKNVLSLRDNSEQRNQENLGLCNLENVGEVSRIQDLIVSEQLGFQGALNLIVQRALSLTRATGTAIALREGDKVICCAQAGNAPELGVELPLDSSLSGQCFRSGAMVMCSDIVEHMQLTPELTGRLNFRSLLIVPILAANDEVIGILEALSEKAQNFSSSDVLSLSLLAEIIQEFRANPKIGGKRADDNNIREELRGDDVPYRIEDEAKRTRKDPSQPPTKELEISLPPHHSAVTFLSRVSMFLRRAFRD